MQERFKVSVQRSCRLALLRRSVWYAKSRARDQSALRQRIRDIAMNRPRFGYLRVQVMLRREGWQVNKKRVYRLYRLDGLQLRMKVRRRKRIALCAASAAGHRCESALEHGLCPRPDARWTDISHPHRDRSVESRECVSGGQLQAVGAVRRPGPGPGSRAQRGWPQAITVDNGTEFTSKALDEWAYRRGVKLDYTRPGKPTDNGLIESFNGRLRDEFLNVHEFVTMHDAREKLKAWQDDYNTIGHMARSAT